MVKPSAKFQKNRNKTVRGVLLRTQGTNVHTCTPVGELKDRHTGGCIDGRTDGRTDGQTEGRKAKGNLNLLTY